MASQLRINSVNYSAAPFGAPQQINLRLANAIIAPNYEGLWLPSGFIKGPASLEVSGSQSTLSLSIYGTNQFDPPLNSYAITIAGSKTTGDITTLVITNPNLPAGSVSLAYTSLAGDSVTLIAAGLVALINANTALAALGIQATNLAGVITLTFPSVPPGQGAADTLPSPTQNITIVSGSSNGTETVTVAVSTAIGSIIGSALTALAITSVTIIPRWIKARITTLTGGGATITADLNGAA